MSGVAFPRLAENLCAARFRDLLRAVGHVVIGSDDDFGDPARNAVERAADARRFIAGDEADGNRKRLICGHTLH